MMEHDEKRNYTRMEIDCDIIYSAPSPWRCYG